MSTSLQTIEQYLGLSFVQEAPDRDQLRRSKHVNNYLLDSEGKLIGLHLGEEINDTLTLGTLFQDLQLLKIKSPTLRQIIFEIDMPQLDLLDLSACALEDFTLPVGFKSLETVILCHNPINKLEFLGELVENLEVFDVSYSKLKTIILSSYFPKLGYFYAYNCGLESFRAEQDLPELQVLELRKNPLSKIHLEKCKRIQQLDLSELQLREFSPDLTQKLPDSLDLMLSGNPLLNIPPEIFEKEDQTWQRIKTYFKALASGKVKAYQPKVILIGNGRVGKTSLVKRWLLDQYDENETSAHAIQFFRSTISLDNPDLNVQLNIGDFGGPEIYHATHRLFMKTKAIFILVWDRDTENTPQYLESLADGTQIAFPNHPLQYWLNYANLLGQKALY